MDTEFKTIQEIVYDKLKQRIVSGVYEPGARLIASDLAAEFNISRMPVREALTRLGTTGLVDIIPYKGAVVNEFTVEDFVEIYHIRAVLEGLAARLACPNLREQDLEKMRLANLEIKEMMNENDVDFQRVNRIFHSTIWERTKSERLQTLLATLYTESAQYRQMTIIHPQRLAQIHQEHERLLDALCNNDPTLAEDVVKDHYEKTLQWLLDLKTSDEKQRI